MNNYKITNISVSGNVNWQGNSDKPKTVIINGNLRAKHENFEILKVRGNSELELVNINQLGNFFGTARFTECQFNNLELHGIEFAFKNSVIQGNIDFKLSQFFFFRPKGKIILDNTIVKGSIKLPQRATVIYRNGGKINQKIIKKNE